MGSPLTEIRPASQARTSGVEVLIAEAHEHARRRRIRNALAVLVIAAAVTAGVFAIRGSNGASHGNAGAIPRTGAAHATGNVTGSIEPCTGAITSTTKLVSPGGLVTVLRGHLWYKRIRPGVHRIVTPRTVVATQRVPRGQRFSFRLPPGHYVLTANRDSTAGPQPSLPEAISVRAGHVTHAHIPSGCL